MPAASVDLAALRGICMYAVRYCRVLSARFHPNRGRMIRSACQSDSFRGVPAHSPFV